MKKIYLDLGVTFIAFGVGTFIARWLNDAPPTETNIAFLTFGLLLVGLSFFKKNEE